LAYRRDVGILSIVQDGLLRVRSSDSSRSGSLDDAKVEASKHLVRVRGLGNRGVLIERSRVRQPSRIHLGCSSCICIGILHNMAMAVTLSMAAMNATRST
jgi:hypothetical protein